MDKKSASITIKTTPEVKDKLTKIAAGKEWTVSQTCNKIITEALKDGQWTMDTQGGS